VKKSPFSRKPEYRSDAHIGREPKKLDVGKVEVLAQGAFDFL